MCPLSAAVRLPISVRMAPSILLVDDHPLTRDGLAALLAGHGFDVVGEAADGREAIDLAHELQPDVILLDLSIPGLNGLEALPRLRAEAPNCEVVVLTASGDEENRRSNSRRRGRLPPEDRAARAPRRLPPRRRRGRGRALGSSRAGCSNRSETGMVPTAVSPNRSRAACRRGSSRSCSSSTSISGPTKIARRLFISEHTMRSHVKSLLRKLDVSSRRGAL